MRTALTLVAVMLGSSSVAAEPPGLVIPTPGAEFPYPWVVREQPPVVEKVSYRWQVLVSDVAAIGALMLSAQRESRDWGSIGFATYSLGAPIIHAANGHGARAMASLALRIGTPLVAGLVGGHLDNRGSVSCSLVPGSSDCVGDGVTERLGFVKGLVVGAVVAMALDTWLVARPKTRVRSAFTPTASALRNGGTIGVAGNF